MGKVLLVDTNFSSKPIYDALIQRGHEVHVVGNNPADCLAKICPHYWQIDYSQTDLLATLVEKESFDHLVPGCTDQSYTSCSIVSNGRFDGISTKATDELLNRKDLFRTLAQNIGLPVPNIQWKDSALATERHNSRRWRWPLVVKPVDAFSGRGITAIAEPNLKALDTAMFNARASSRIGQCVVEDFVIGELYSHSGFLRNGRIENDVFVQEHSSANPFVVDTSRLLPSFHSTARSTLRQSINVLASELRLSDGLVHTQFIFDGLKPWIIELTRRCPGDLYSQLVEMSGASGYVERYIAPFLGLPTTDLEMGTYVPIMRHTVTVPSSQRFSYLHFRKPIAIERWIPLSLTGDQLQGSPTSRIGVLFARAEEESELTTLIASTTTRQLYDVVQ